jgi:addiction module HigA family antidote
MSQTHIEFDPGNEYQPDEVTPPGETLQEVLADRRMTQTELADRLGMAHKTVNEIIKGKAPVTHETALALECVLGIPASFWNNYEAAYRESLARRAGTSRLVSAMDWLAKTPWKEAVRLRWLRERPNLADQLAEVLRFLGIASPDQFDRVYGALAVQWRQPVAKASDVYARAFWLRRGELLAAELVRSPDIAWAPYSPREFEARLTEARRLTCDCDPKSFMPALQRLCALAGVAVVFVEELAGTRASGATRWVAPDRALIQLSLRYKTHDSLWFSFFHESCHVLKHPKRGMFVEEAGAQPTEFEMEANQFAENLLIPKRNFMELRAVGEPSADAIEDFARRIGVDPGIVVGRLQTENVIGRNRYNELKQHYRLSSSGA